MTMAFFEKILLGMKSVSTFFHKPKFKKWQDIEFFDSRWKERIKQMAVFIEPNKKVLDLGCGKMWLKEYMPENCIYIPVDYTSRSADCIVADFNKKEFPNVTTDVAFISGCLEYVIDYKWFIRCVSQCSNQVIISYCTIDEFGDKNTRKKYHWVNHLSAQKVIYLFSSLGFRLKTQAKTNDNNHLFVFGDDKKGKLHSAT